MNFDINDKFGFWEHCKVTELILNEMEVNPHTKHHIRASIREATKKVSKIKGCAKSRAEYMSIDSLNKLKEGAVEGFVLEHGVPVSILYKMIIDLEDRTAANIADLIYSWTVLSVVTIPEHERLRELGLTKSMPENWDGNDKFARYNAAGIVLTENNYKKLYAHNKSNQSQQAARTRKMRAAV